MIFHEKRISAARMVEDVVGCKRSLAGLSKKALNERLRKLVRFGALAREAYPEVPPRVEYRLTPFGEKFTGLMDGVERLQRELESSRA